MSIMALKSNAAMSRKSEIRMMDRMADYFIRNRKMILLGLCAASCRVPNACMMREMKIL